MFERKKMRDLMQKPILCLVVPFTCRFSAKIKLDIVLCICNNRSSLCIFLWLDCWTLCFYGSTAGSRGTTSITDVCAICLSVFVSLHSRGFCKTFVIHSGNQKFSRW